jgi:hypothetical protein
VVAAVVSLIAAASALAAQQIHADMTTVPFGNQKVGTTSPDQVVTITNTGDADLHISTVMKGGGDGGQFNMNETCAGATVIPSSGSCTITLSFSPTSTGSKLATVTVASDDPVTPSLVINLTGTGTQGAIDEDTGALSFGSVQTGSESAPQTVTFTNAGTAIVNVAVNQLAEPNPAPNPFVDGPGATQFFVTSQSCSLAGEEKALDPTETCSVTLVFSPSALGPQTATLTLTHDAPDSPEEISLSGTGTAPPVVTGPPPPPPVDVGKNCKKKHGKKKKKCKKSSG